MTRNASEQKRENHGFNNATMDAYNKLAKESGAKADLTEKQKKQIAVLYSLCDYDVSH